MSNCVSAGFRIKVSVQNFCPILKYSPVQHLDRLVCAPSYSPLHVEHGHGLCSYLRPHGYGREQVHAWVKAMEQKARGNKQERGNSLSGDFTLPRIVSFQWPHPSSQLSFPQARLTARHLFYGSPTSLSLCHSPFCWTPSPRDLPGIDR